MAESPLRMAQYRPREITVADSPGDSVAKAFVDEWKALGADTVIFEVAKLARMYGAASLALLEKDKDVSTAVDFDKLAKREIDFNIYDPLNTAGSLVLSQQPERMDFLKSTRITVDGNTLHRSRTVVMMNEGPVYLSYTVSAFGYVGRSVYQRALFPLKSFIQTMMTDDLVSSKAGVLIAKIKQAGSIITNLMANMFGFKREIVKESKTYGVISIGPDDNIESLNLQNIDGAVMACRKNILENIAVAADMPALLLNSETFAEGGFGEGQEDAKHVARFVDGIRTWMQPLYDFFDKVVMYRAWTPEFYATMQKQYPQTYPKKMEYAEAFTAWKNSFSAVWPSLLTEPQSELAKQDDVRLKAMLALCEILMPACDPENRARVIEWLADNFNALEHLFETPLELDYEALAEFGEEQAAQAQQAAMAGPEEPKPPKPEAANDSANIRQLLSTVVGMDRRLKRLPVALGN